MSRRFEGYPAARRPGGAALQHAGGGGGGWGEEDAFPTWLVPPPPPNGFDAAFGFGAPQAAVGATSETHPPVVGLARAESSRAGPGERSASGCEAAVTRAAGPAGRVRWVAYPAGARRRGGAPPVAGRTRPQPHAPPARPPQRHAARAPRAVAAAMAAVHVAGGRRPAGRPRRLRRRHFRPPARGLPLGAAGLRLPVGGRAPGGAGVGRLPAGERAAAGAGGVAGPRVRVAAALEAGRARHARHGVHGRRGRARRLRRRRAFLAAAQALPRVGVAPAGGLRRPHVGVPHGRRPVRPPVGHGLWRRGRGAGLQAEVSAADPRVRPALGRVDVALRHPGGADQAGQPLRQHRRGRARRPLRGRLRLRLRRLPIRARRLQLARGPLVAGGEPALLPRPAGQRLRPARRALPLDRRRLRAGAGAGGRRPRRRPHPLLPPALVLSPVRGSHLGAAQRERRRVGRGRGGVRGAGRAARGGTRARLRLGRRPARRALLQPGVARRRRLLEHAPARRTPRRLAGTGGAGQRDPPVPQRPQSGPGAPPEHLGAEQPPAQVPLRVAGSARDQLPDPHCARGRGGARHPLRPRIRVRPHGGELGQRRLRLQLLTHVALASSQDNCRSHRVTRACDVQSYEQATSSLFCASYRADDR